jgi:hypothetical protein
VVIFSTLGNFKNKVYSLVALFFPNEMGLDIYTIPTTHQTKLMVQYEGAFQVSISSYNKHCFVGFVLMTMVDASWWIRWGLLIFPNQLSS